MLVKLYEICWAAFAGAMLLTFLTNTLTSTAVVIFGFIAFGLVFMGMIGVLPFMVSEQLHAKQVSPAAAAQKSEFQQASRSPHVKSVPV